MATSEAAFEITLRSADGFDPFDERQFSLPLNKTIVIGRASKNALKKELMSGRNNAFIDSPVISREHAVLSAKRDAGAAQVYIADSTSMHGTTVNGDRLEPNKPRQLSNGDKLQFGINVTRNDSFFKAQNYVFQSRLFLLPSHQTDGSFSQGFSVPEDDSSEEEAGWEPAPHPARWGSQNNPVTIDDFEDLPPTKARQLPVAEDKVIENEEGEVEVEETLVHPEPEPEVSGDVTDERVSSPQLEPRDTLPESKVDKNGVLPSDLESVAEDVSADDEYGRSVYTSEEEDASHEDDDNISEGDSIDYPSGSENSDVENDEDADIVRRLKMEAMLSHEHQKSASKSSMTTSLPPIQEPPAFVSPPTVHASSHHNPPPCVIGASASGPFITKPAPSHLGNEVPELDMGSTSIFEDPWADNVFNIPPRPSAPRPPAHWSSSEFSSPYNAIPREADSLRWYREESPPNMFLPAQPEYRGNPFSRPADPLTFESVQPKPFTAQFAPAHPVENSEAFQGSKSLISEIQTASGVQTPPPMSAADAIGSTSSPPNRRTKVSIGEIVEDPQPATPTSVTSLKRKADVLEEDEVHEVDTDGITASAVEMRPAPEDTEMEVASSHAEQRPRKRLRAIGHAAKTAATYLAPAALTWLFFSAQSVDGFFEGRVS